MERRGYDHQDVYVLGGESCEGRFTCEPRLDDPVEDEVDDGYVAHWHQSFRGDIGAFCKGVQAASQSSR